MRFLVAFIILILPITSNAQILKNLFSKPMTWELTKSEEEEVDKLIKQDIQYLASFQLEGRKAGELGAQNAANYIKNRLKQMNFADVNMPHKFPILTNTRFGPRTRLTINNAFVRIPEEAIPLSFSAKEDFKGHFVKDLVEPLTPWIISLFNDEKEAHNLKDQWLEQAYKLAKEAEDHDAVALFLYDKYNVVSIHDIPKKSFETLKIPVVLLSKTVYDKYLINQKTISPISLVLDYIDVEKETENVYGFINHHSDKTIIISSSYDYLGFYYDNSQAYGNNKMVNFGADLNASGVAAALALANILQTRKDLGSDYNYLFAFYSASQSNHQGVKYFMDLITFPLSQQIVAAIHLDNVGKYKPREGVYITGRNQTDFNKPLLEHGSTYLKMTFGGEIPAYSDAVVYELHKVPTLQINTGVNLDHGKPSDHLLRSITHL